MVIYEREIEQKIKSLLFKGRAILLFGPRQAGKTTLAKKILDEYFATDSYFNCEFAEVRNKMVEGRPEILKGLVGDRKIVVFDEAQTVQNIGFIFKTFIDTYPEVQIIATGSSSFDLANKINEPLTGRSFEFTLYPLSLSEIKKSKKIVVDDIFEYLNFGMYPSVVAEETRNSKENILKNIATNYIYKDIYVFESIKNPVIFESLLKMLAYQIGQLVSVNELSKSLGVSRNLIDKYLRLLEQSYVIKRINSFSRNNRNELKKAFKVYFLDIGIRNAIIENLNSDIRNRKDGGFLFENFVFLELLKKSNLENFTPVIYFWRTSTKLEIDFITVKGDEVKAYESKLGSEMVYFSKFLELYQDTECVVVRPETFLLDVLL